MTEQPEPDELERLRRETARKIALEAIADTRAALKAARDEDRDAYWANQRHDDLAFAEREKNRAASGPMETPTQEPAEDQK